MAKGDNWQYTIVVASRMGAEIEFIEGELPDSLRGREIDRYAGITAVLNQYGGEGWELVGVTDAGADRIEYVLKKQV